MAPRVLLFVVVAVAAVLAGAAAHEARSFLGHPEHHVIGNYPMVREKHPDPAPYNPTMSALPSVIPSMGTVRVTWDGVNDATKNDDFIALYAPADSPDDEFLDFHWTNSTLVHTHDRPMEGAVAFSSLLNMRTDMSFRYWRFNGTAYVLTAETNVVTFAEGALMPMQAHLAVTPYPSEMRLMWVSGVYASGDPVVEWGTDPDRLGNRAVATYHTYSAADLCAAPANITSARRFRDPGRIHDVVMEGLLPATTYYYRYGVHGVGMAEVRKFTTAAPLDSAGAVLRAAVYADMGAWSGLDQAGAWTVAMRLQQHVTELFDLVVHAGDLSYSRSRSYLWEQWHHLIEPIATKVPYLVGIGNHEYDYIGNGNHDPSGASTPDAPCGFHPSWGNYGTDSYGECGVPVVNRFHMPEAPAGSKASNGPFWYSFNAHHVHWLMISSEHDWRVGSPQYAWMAADLAAVNRTLTPWVFLSLHRPMYASQERTSPVIQQHMRDNLDPLLYKWGVDLVFSGHVHSYERSHQVMNNTRTDGAPLHLMIGTAGAELTMWDYTAQPWSAYRSFGWGYGLINVTASTASFEFRRATDDGQEDWVTLTKSAPTARATVTAKPMPEHVGDVSVHHTVRHVLAKLRAKDAGEPVPDAPEGTTDDAENVYARVSPLRRRQKPLQ